MRLRKLVLFALPISTACASGAVVPERAAIPASAPGALVVGYTVGRYRLHEIEVLGTGPRDTLYRFTDGTNAVVSAIRYDVPPDAQVGADSQAWVEREGVRFEQAQDALVAQGRIDGYRRAFSSAQPLAIDSALVTEHSVAIGVRVRGAIRMDFQYLYLVGGRMLKMRGSFFGDSWQTSEFPNFAREVARTVHRESVHPRSNDGWY